MAYKIQNKKSRAVCIVKTDEEWQRLFVDKGVDKLYNILEHFPDGDALKKPFIPKEIQERRNAQVAVDADVDAPTEQQRRERVVKQKNKEIRK
jgi:hypothetical protein